MRSAIEQGRISGIVDGSAEVSDVLESLRAALPSLSLRSRHVAGFVLAHPDRVVEMSASRLASETETSVGTVVRLCHLIGLPGIHALKLQLAAQLGVGRLASPLPTDTAGAVTFARIVDDLRRAASVLDHDAIERVTGALRDARRVLIIASGTSQPLAIEFGNWLSSAGRSVAYPTDNGTQEAVARQLAEGDVCFAISHSGTTAATIHPLQIAAEQGALTAALTSYSGAPLARLVGAAIVAGAAGDGIRSEDMASRMVHHAVLQVIRSLLLSSVSPLAPLPPRSN